MIPGNRSPFDYVAWSFFEGWGSFEGAVGRRVVEPRDAVVWANRGGGKTIVGAVATLLDMMFKPGIEVRILGGSMDQSKRMYAHLRRLLGRAALADMVDGKLSATRLKLVNGSELELMSQSQASVRGTRVQKLRCDEVELFDAEVWEAAQLTTRSRRIEVPGVGSIWVRGSVECLSTMHVPHGLMYTLVKDAGGKREIFRWGVVDVLGECGPEHACRREEDGSAAVISLPILDEKIEPRAGDCVLLGECRGRAKGRGAGAGARTGHIGVEDAAGMKGRVSAATWESEMLCLRPRRTDAVLGEFEAARHVVAHEPWAGGEPWAAGDDGAGVQWVCGMDFGFRALTVILLAALDGQGRLWVVRERALAESLLAEHIAAIWNGLKKENEAESPGPGWEGKPLWIGIDPAGRARNEQTGIGSAHALEKAGLKVRDARLGLQEGLELVRARLKPADGGLPRLYVHERCVKLIESIERYHYPRDRPECSVPEKDGHDHAVDALRYLVQNVDKPTWTRMSRYA
jgi:hypothetical protein